ncbi:MAG: hypothetical protein LH605_04910 [Microbacteriaceae bacterium]|nr:hypothetical protein [Microbacteriaceae bacterium]
MPTFTHLIDERCPQCDSTNPLEIVHGEASSEMLAAADAGLIAIGGPVVADDNAAYRCRRLGCGVEWGRVDWHG